MANVPAKPAANPVNSSSSEPKLVPGGTDGSTRELLRRLELTVAQRIDGLLHGDHRGLLAGHGTELGETRKYAPGDDVRRIDWNVTARLSEPHIRQTISERELSTWLIVDQSARLDFGTTGSEKRDLALAIAAAIGFLTNRDGNRLGAVLAHSDESTIIQSKSSRKHLLYLLDTIASAPRRDDSGVTNLGAAIDRCSSLAKRRGLVVIISDFFVEPGWQTHIGGLARKHDVIAVQITDPREFELPDVGLITVRDPATGHQVEVPTHKKSVREAYAKAAVDRQDKLSAQLRAGRADHLVLSTGRDWVGDLVAHVIKRSQHLSGTKRRASTVSQYRATNAPTTPNVKATK